LEGKRLGRIIDKKGQKLKIHMPYKGKAWLGTGYEEKVSARRKEKGTPQGPISHKAIITKGIKYTQKEKRGKKAKKKVGRFKGFSV